MTPRNILRVRISLKGRPINSQSFDQDVITIGRDPDADIFLDNPSISREHVRIERLPQGHYSIKDLGSANGSYLNDERIDASMIYSSDVLQIGKYSLWLSVERDHRAEEPKEIRRTRAEAEGQTMMLSNEELERMMAASRKPAPPSETVASSQTRGSSTPAYPSANARPKRTQQLIGIGIVIILATSLGAGFAWLFLR